MASLLAACVTAFLVSFLILPLIIKFMLAKNLVDVPGRRKIHKKVTPSLGGIAIFVGFLISTVTWIEAEVWMAPNMRYILASVFIIFLIGVRDDLVPFRAMHKLYGQLIAVTIFIFSGVTIGSFYGLFGIHEIPTWLGFVLTGLSIVVITNAFNLIDGLDGLAGSIGFTSLLAFGLWFFWVGDIVYATLCLSMTGAILAFLVFNWQPAEIFMGDTGAMVIGMMLGLMAIHFMNTNELLPVDSPAKFTATIATAACFVIVPLADTVRIIILRISKGQSPFSPDKSHIHHALMRIGLTHGKTALILATVNISFIAGAFLFRDMKESYKLAGLIIVAGLLSFILDRIITRRVSTKGA